MVKGDQHIALLMVLAKNVGTTKRGPNVAVTEFEKSNPPAC